MSSFYPLFLFVQFPTTTITNNPVTKITKPCGSFQKFKVVTYRKPKTFVFNIFLLTSEIKGEGRER